MMVETSAAVMATLRAIERVFGLALVDHVTNPVITIDRGRDGLRDLLWAMRVTRGAEVGVWKGEHAEQLCRHLPGMRLLAVDPWATYPEYHEQKSDPAAMANAYRQAEARLRTLNCTILRRHSVEAAAGVPAGSLDFVYIDGNHEAPFVTADLEAWLPRVRSGGLLSGHDYHVNPRKAIQVKPAVDSFVQARGGTLFVLAGDRTPSFFWVVR
jgi:hypothetical protein